MFLQVARGSSVTKLVEKLKNMYLEKGGNDFVPKRLYISLLIDSTVHSSVAYTINAIVMHSPDVAKGIAIDLAPLVFLAMHMPVKQEGQTNLRYNV